MFRPSQKPVTDAENTPEPHPQHDSKDTALSVQRRDDENDVTRTTASGRESGGMIINPLHFFTTLWGSASDASRLCNILWPVVPAALAVRYARSDLHLVIFILNYIAMVPCANTIGVASQEFSRKIPKVVGIVAETALGSIVELILFIVLLTRDQFLVIKSAILGSILATLLLCLGLCFLAGGIRRNEQEFSETVSEVGSGLLLTAGLALTVPSAYYNALSGTGKNTEDAIQSDVLHISRVASVLLIIAYLIYIWFQMRTHHSIYNAILEQDKEKNTHKHRNEARPKLTFAECIVALTISVTLVTLVAISLVEQIDNIVQDHGVTEAFMGLILVPVVEKAAEHITAIDEAWDDQMNFALSHVLGATIQTSLFNAPLVVIVGWGLGKTMNLNFEMFEIVVLILSILVVGNFLRDQKSNYLEGSLCVIVYAVIAVAAFYYPGTSTVTTRNASGLSEGGPPAE